MITMQYLEPGPHIAEITPSHARIKLQTAFDHLPIDFLLLGWDIPRALEDVCRDVTDRAGAKLYRWHPLLTGDGTFYPEKEWRARNLDGLPLCGFRNLPEFTFVCPNQPAAREVILTHVGDLAQSGRYDGIFLDRMRHPSPAADPVNLMGCFCERCGNAANRAGLDLVNISQSLLDIDECCLLRVFCGEPIQPLSEFLDFRQHTITQFITEIVEIIRSAGLEIGLDCFSPTLTRMVGQDLTALTTLADWTKIMIYGHAFGPATLPFELSSLVNWLVERQGVDESEALTTLAAITSLSLPTFLTQLYDAGLSPATLAVEYERGRQLTCNNKLLAGIELVQMPGVSELNAVQIENDLRAIKATGADGLSLSWDLWQIPIEWLEIVDVVWFS